MLEWKYNEYQIWHNSADKAFLTPALNTALRLVEELLDHRVDSVDRGRFRISTSRVKSAQRSYAKLSREKYASQIEVLEDVPSVIDDLVGLRLVCNNLSDINTFQEIVGELPIESPVSSASLAIEQDSHRDYFASPKPSGYRAYHVNIVVPVPHMKGNRRIRVEIQARTLLQDGWGELTHEDTYKPGSEVPEWIVGMSLRMAELLAAVDNIAQDLRTGLDVEAQRSVREVDPQQIDPAVTLVPNRADRVDIPISPENIPESTSTNQTLDFPKRYRETEIEAALISETKSAVRKLRKPLPLAALSQRLTLVFGTEITRVWANRGGFKNFLEFVAPEAKISGPAPGYIHPPNTSIPDGWTTEDTGTGVVPGLARELRTYDKALPLIGAERINQVIVAVANVLQSLKSSGIRAGNLSVSQIDDLARQARSNAEQRGELVVRPHASYALQTANRAGKILPSTNADDLRQILLERILEMAQVNDLVNNTSDAQQEVKEWFGLESTNGPTLE